jgi:hypothetical protein
MTEITPRFFVLPLIALAVIASLPRTAPQVCSTQAITAGVIRLDTGSPNCAATRQIAMNSDRALVR